MTNFEMILKNPDYQHVIRESLITNCAVGKDNHMHLCTDLNCADCSAGRIGTCTSHLEKWLDEEFRPVFKKEGEDA